MGVFGTKPPEGGHEESLKGFHFDDLLPYRMIHANRNLNPSSDWYKSYIEVRPSLIEKGKWVAVLVNEPMNFEHRYKFRFTLESVPTREQVIQLMQDMGVPAEIAIIYR